MFVLSVLVIGCSQTDASSQGSTTGSAAGPIEPFGFPLGGVVPQSVIETSKCTAEGTGLMCVSAPKPLKDAQGYGIARLADGRVAKVMMITNETADEGGVKVKAQFAELKAILVEKYGPPAKDIDSVKEGGQWTDNPVFYAMSLKEDERRLAALWNVDGRVGILLEAESASGIGTLIKVLYEDDALLKILQKESDGAGREAL